MKLNGSQIGELRNILLATFSLNELRILVREKLDVVLEHKVSTAQNGEEIAFDLIDAVNREDQVMGLLCAARKARPHVRDLELFCAHLSGPVSASTPMTRRNHPLGAHDAAAPQNVDLTDVVSTCFNKFFGKGGGLFGFSISCDSQACLRHFADRLREKLGPRTLRAQGCMTLSPTYTSVEEKYRIVTRHRDGLRSNDYLFCFQVSDRTIAGEFWRRLREGFGGKLDRRLIIVLAFTPPDVPELDEVCRLPNPVLTTEHLFDWIQAIAQANEWEPGTQLEILVNTMYERFPVRPPALGDEVYDFIEQVLQFLETRPSFETFLRSYQEPSGHAAPST
jgi:hypothetical protein